MGIQAEQRKERSEGQADPFLLKWEYPVILTLGSLNLILICIIVVLARRHRNLRRRLKQEQPRYNLITLEYHYLNLTSSHVPGSLTRNIYSPCPVAGEEKLGGGEGGKGAEGGDIQLYTSDSDISSEQQSSEGSDKGGGRGATDTSYCSDSPTFQPTCNLQPTQYNTLQPHNQYVTVQPCCAGYMSSLSPLQPSPTTMLLPSNFPEETSSLLSSGHGTFGRGTQI